MTRKLTTKEFKEKVYNLVGNEYSVLGEYTNSVTKLIIRHNSTMCNSHEYLIKPSSFLSGNRCPKCNNMRKGRKPKTTQDFKKELYEIVGDEYELLSKYNGVYNKLTLLHKKCGREWKVTPNAFISSKNRCHYCRMVEHNKKQRKTHSQFIDDVQELYGNDYIILGEYTNSKTKIRVKHKCGKEWEIKPSHLLTRDMCPRCKSSIGEKHITTYLNNLDIEFETQKMFKDLKYRKNLSYDFYIPKYNLLIEYQGLQHYQPIETFGGEKAYKSQVKKDNIKRKYAKDNGYNIIEVSYKYKYYNKIKEYLDKEIEKLLA